MRSIVDEIMREFDRARALVEKAYGPSRGDEGSRMLVEKTVRLTMDKCRAALLAGRMDLIVPEMPPEERRVPPVDPNWLPCD